MTRSAESVPRNRTFSSLPDDCRRASHDSPGRDPADGPSSVDRRGFLQRSTALGITAFAWLGTERRGFAQPAHSKNDRHPFGLIGAGGQGSYDAKRAKPFADIVAIADVDSQHAEQAKQGVGDPRTELYGDYRRLLDRDDIDAVIIGTPDHWHTKICLDALRAGKDVYCEKPLTLTIDEGKLLCREVKRTGRVFQVGTQQRSEPPHLFLTAVAMCRDGRLGKIHRVQAAIGGGPTGGPFPKAEPPAHLDWDRWLGPAPLVDYMPQRCHGSFRWWYEYSGGKMTDWGAHHVDIAHWVLDAADTGPVRIGGTATHPVPLEHGMPTRDDSFNTATEFLVDCEFADGTRLVIRHDTDNGVLIEGEKGRIFVNRGRLTGAPVDALKDDPLPEGLIEQVYKGKKPGYHMRNFVECMRDRTDPISDVYSHHRAITTCHLANIAIRLGRTLKWDPKSEQIIGDDEANRWLSRPSRRGYEVA